MDRTDIPSCTLSDSGLAQQLERHAGLAPHVVGARLHERELTVELAPGYDRALLHEMLAVERECCPFFEFALDEHARLLRVGVSEAGQAPALAALAHSLGAAGQAVRGEVS